MVLNFNPSGPENAQNFTLEKLKQNMHEAGRYWPKGSKMDLTTEKVTFSVSLRG